MAINIIFSHPTARKKTTDSINGRLIIIDRGVSPTPDRFSVWKQHEDGQYLSGEHFQYLSDALANFADKLKVEEQKIEITNCKWSDMF